MAFSCKTLITSFSQDVRPRIMRKGSVGDYMMQAKYLIIALSNPLLYIKRHLK